MGKMMSTLGIYRSWPPSNSNMQNLLIESRENVIMKLAFVASIASTVIESSALKLISRLGLKLENQ